MPNELDPVRDDEDEDEDDRQGGSNTPETVTEAGCALLDGWDTLSGCNDGCSLGDNCNLGCDPGCNLLLTVRLFPRLSTLLLIAAVLVPNVGGGWAARSAIVGYRRYLTRLTPPCPSTPSCSAYALSAVSTLGPRRGLTQAAARLHSCGRPRNS